MKYHVKKKCARKINTFYRNVAKKYKHTYSEQLMHQNIDEALDSICQIERSLLRRKPTLDRWKGYYMANTMGDHRNSANLAVAKRENASILYEINVDEN